MFFTDTDNQFKIISVLFLDLPSQNVIIPERPFHILSYRLSGGAAIETPPQKINLSSNDLFYIPPGTAYHIDSHTEQVFAINFEMTKATDQGLQSFTPINATVFQNLFQDLYNTWIQKRAGYYFHSMSLFYKILENMNLQFSSNSNFVFSPEMSNAINYLHQNYTNPELTIAKLCSTANLSDTQFRKIFYKAYNTTPLSYINRLRINYAADLLTNTVLTVEKISTLSGFSDAKYFSTVFHKYMKTSPSSFRLSTYIPAIEKNTSL